LDREGFIAIIGPVRDLIFIEKIAACYISSVGAGLAPALYEYISYYGSGGQWQAQPLLFLFFIVVSLSCLFHLLIDEMFHCFKILILYQ